MITDPLDIQTLTNKAKCFACKKRINPNLYVNVPHYQISLQTTLNSVSMSTHNNFPGRGAILRFHIECFVEVAGEEYLFDRTIWK